MKFRVEVISVNDDGAEQRHDVMEMERQQLAMETLGLSLAEGKAILRGVQDFVASQQTAEYLERQRNCPGCGQRYHSKEAGTSTVATVFGPVAVPNPRWERCSCQVEGPKTFRPTATWLKGRASPEMLYLETTWGSRIPYEKVADLLKEVLPVGESTNHETVRGHLQAVAERMEAELGEERQPDPVKPEEDPGLPLPDGPMTVGIDGGYVRAAHKEGCFEVIAGRSVVAFRRRGEDVVPPPKCFGFVQTYDPKPRRRLWELMKSQGMQENQQVVFLSDGGEDVRQVREYLHPNGEHVIDWFHITMRLTVLQQQTKSLKKERQENGAAASKQLVSIKHLLWHGNVEEALERLTNLLMDVELIRSHAAPAEKLATGVEELETYIRNNQESIPDYGERYRQWETISTAFVESTINQVVSRRFVKRQQMVRRDKPV
ncbi:MAG: ISKra4 family transposase [Terriglobia bacterium]